MELQFKSSILTDIVVLIGLSLIQSVSAFPSGAPLSACSHLMPVHVDGVLENTASPYILIMNETTYGTTPLKLTISVAGVGARDFMAFMLQARSEFGQPAGYFSDFPTASKGLTCYEKDDTMTHTAAYTRSFMEVIWHPPSKNIGKISITGSIAVSKIKYWAVESRALSGQGPVDRSGAVQVQQTYTGATTFNTGPDAISSDGVIAAVSGASKIAYFILPLIVKNFII